MRPEWRADDRQRDNVRAELHAAVDFVIDAWSHVDRMARTMGAGYPTGGGSGGPSRMIIDGEWVDVTAVERAVLTAEDRRSDVEREAREWLAGFAELRAHALVLERRARRLLPPTAQPMLVRVSSVADCVNCGQPALPRPRAGRCENCYRFRLRHDGADRKPDQP